MKRPWQVTLPWPLLPKHQWVSHPTIPRFRSEVVHRGKMPVKLFEARARSLEHLPALDSQLST